MSKANADRICPSAKIFAFLVAAALGLALVASKADAAENAAAGWISAKVRVPFADRFSFQLQIEPRLFEQPDQLRILLVRPWFDVRLSQGFTLALGYDALVFFKASDRREHRLWQQVAHGHSWKHLSSMAHFRLEERFFSDVSGVSVRGRFLVGATVPLGREVDFIIKNEFFVNFNQVPIVGQQGYAENRLYGGFGRRFAPWVYASLGYQMQWLNLPAGDLINHTVMVGLELETPALARRRSGPRPAAHATRALPSTPPGLNLPPGDPSR